MIKMSSFMKVRVQAGFTLIETMAAISLLMIAVIAPMSLTAQALQSAYYARDQIVASNLAQEALEQIRAVRDGNILHNALSPGAPVDLLVGIPVGTPFRVDIPHNTITDCSSDPGGICKPLETDGTLFGYSSGWTPTNFRRSITATFVPGTSNNEIHIVVTVTWQTSRFQLRTFQISENLYRWVEDGSAT